MVTGEVCPIKAGMCQLRPRGVTIQTAAVAGPKRYLPSLAFSYSGTGVRMSPEMSSVLSALLQPFFLRARP